MNKPEFTINPATGKKLMKWCNNGVDLQQVKNEIQQCQNLEALRNIYAKYPNLKSLIIDDIMAQKAMIEDVQNVIIPNSEIIEQEQKLSENGTENTAS